MIPMPRTLLMLPFFCSLLFLFLLVFLFCQAKEINKGTLAPHVFHLKEGKEKNCKRTGIHWKMKWKTVYQIDTWCWTHMMPSSLMRR